MNRLGFHAIMVLLVALACTVSSVASEAVASEAGSPGKQIVPPKAEPFALSDVRLLDGPFRKAMEVDRAYLLKLDPDRLLYFMRKVAGLPPRTDGGYGGWDHTSSQSIGHYLSACAMMAAATGDIEVKKRVDYVVNELAECQRARDDGALLVGPVDAQWFADLEQGNLKPLPVTPWYLTHKNLAGLRDAWVHCGNDQARKTLIRLADWCIAVTTKLSDEQWQTMLAGEHGGPHEVLADVYAITGDEKYLRLARKFRHDLIFEPLARGDDTVLLHRHANTQIPKFVAYERIYELTGEDRWHSAASHFWDSVVMQHSWANGGNSQWEEFFPPAEFSTKVLERCGPETCNTYNMLKLTRELYTVDPQVRFIDFYEHALFNHILSAQDPEHGGFVYYTSMRPGHYRVYSRDFDAFWCCVGTGMENHAKYGEMIYAHGPDALYVNLFIPSEVTWTQKGLTLRQQTNFPEASKATLTLNLDQPTTLTLQIRCPGWTEPSRMTLQVNGVPEPISAQAGAYVAVARTWKPGDTVTVGFPMPLVAEFLPNSREYVAFRYGPVLLAAPLGSGGLDSTDFHGDGQLASKIQPLADAPALVGDPDHLIDHLTPVPSQPLSFRTVGLARPDEVTLMPFYRIHHQRYVIYWHVLNETRYLAEREQRAKEERAALELERKTVDRVRIGEQQPEADHHLQGERTESGPGLDLKWRHAADGGWFSYDVKVLPDQPMTVVCTYWGPDHGARTFDILVDGKKIATESLDTSRPGDFVDVRYEIPAEITRGKTTATVKFQAHPSNVAGGLFDLRMIPTK